MLDIRLLQVLKYKQEFTKLVPIIQHDVLDPETVCIIKDFKRYFDTFDTHEVIDLMLFIPRFEQWHSTWEPEHLMAVKGILRNIADDVDTETKSSLTTDLYEYNLATNLYNTVRNFQDGSLELPLDNLLMTELESFKRNVESQSATWNNQSIADLLAEDLNDSGLRWRLPCLNRSMRPLREGDFGIVAARPDKGKTTFMAAEISYMASQLNNDRNVVWLNNESMAGRIRKRIFQAALNKSISELISLSSTGILEDMYIQAIGRMDKIRVFDIHDHHTGQVENILEKNSPGLIVYDMIDNIRGFKSDARTDLQLESMYQWARERAVKYQCVGIATSQISADGEGKQAPNMSLLKDSKTGKQGACDFIVMIGSSDTPNARYLSVPKNKLRREDAPSTTVTEVVFDGQRARYREIGDIHVTQSQPIVEAPTGERNPELDS